MKIYFSCSLTGGRDDQSIYSAIVDWMLAQGHQVPTAHLADADVLAREAEIRPETVYARDIAWLAAAEVVVAEISTPSHGVGYEIAYAVCHGKRALCLARDEVRVSKMLAGNPNVRFERYAGTGDALRTVGDFLKAG